MLVFYFLVNVYTAPIGCKEIKTTFKRFLAPLKSVSGRDDLFLWLFSSLYN